MQPHTKEYLKRMGYDPCDFIPCEICGAKMVDVHHIKCRGMGGTIKKIANHIRNLMGLCRHCHEKYGDKKQFIQYLRNIHDNRMREHGIKL
jgi:hypothetical protein